MLPVTLNIIKMKKVKNKSSSIKIFLLLVSLCWLSASFAQQNMQNMPGMNMSKTKKPVKKPVQKNKQSNVKTPAKKTVSANNKDSANQSMDMNGMQMNMPMKNMSIQDSMNDEEIADEMMPGKVDLLAGKTVRYDLYVRDTMVNFTGKLKRAIAINGSIPAPVLTFTEGDTAEIYLHNELKNEETSLHWHGVILPNEADGVPYLTTSPIHPGETHLYKFRVVQNGTYWYHSHSALQEQSGMYGALIFKKREDTSMHENKMKMNMPMSSADFDAEQTIVLSEWEDENPKETQRRLRTGNDWYAIKKGSTQSYAEAIKEGYFKAKLLNEWKRMKAMDVSDVYYDRFLINGESETDMPQFKAGDKVKLHIVDGGASSYFWMQYAGGKITVVGNDGNDVEPVEVDRMLIAPAETYDVIVTIPQSMSYEFRLTPEDRTKSASLWLGSGMKMPAPVLPKLKYFEGMKMMNDMMKVNGDMKDMGMEMSLQQMDMNTVMYPEITGSGKSQGDMMMEMKNMKMSEKDTTHGMKMNDMQPMHKMKMDSSSDMKMSNMQGMNENNSGNMANMNMSMGSSDIVTLNYAMLRSPFKTALPDWSVKELHFTLTGNMNRYVWTIDNKTVNESDKILIRQGENVRIILTNNSMMRHPMHLHGHDFRVLNGQGDYAPLKNVLDIMPMETDTIEFAGNKTGNWFFHCHILFHMMAGMGKVFTYENSPVNPQLPDASAAYKSFKKDNTMIHPMIMAGIESNGSDGEYMLSSNRYSLQGLWHLGYMPEHGYETEINFGRYIGKMQWLFPYVGFDYHYKKEGGNIKNIFGSEEKNWFGQLSDKDNRHTVVAGVQYTLPSLIVADARVDGNGKFRFQLSREGVPLTPRLRFNFMLNTDKEYATGFRYIVSKWFSLSTHYDSDMGYGAGITMTY